MARQEGVDLAEVAGNGPDGIVTRDDLAAYLGGRAGTSPAAQPVPAAASSGTRTPVRGVQKRMAEAMVRSVAEAPQACVFLSVDVSETTALVERLRASRHFEGVRLTLLGVVAKAVVRALEEHPELNSSWDEDRREILFEPHVNLGIAVAAPSGLLVPNVAQAERLSLKDLARALADLTERAREGKCTPAELRVAPSRSPTSASSGSTGEWPSSTRVKPGSSPSVRSGGRRGRTTARWHCVTSSA